jgi:hypothetical protein
VSYNPEVKGRHVLAFFAVVTFVCWAGVKLTPILDGTPTTTAPPAPTISAFDHPQLYRDCYEYLFSDLTRRQGFSADSAEFAAHRTCTEKIESGELKP